VAEEWSTIIQTDRRYFMELAETEPSLPISLHSVICTQELKARTARKPDSEALNGALVMLARTLANSPERILQQLVETALELCGAQSAGLSLLEEENGQKIFRWHGVAGQYAPHLWGTTPREFSPCGTVLDTDSVLLMSRLDRHFTYFAQVEPRIAEALLIPFHVRGQAVGTIWVIAHDQTLLFDAEDARVLTTLGEFAAGAYQALSGTLALKSVVATIREPLLVLDSTLRVQMASRSFYNTFQVTPVATEGRLLYELGNGEWDVPALRTLLEDLSPGESAIEAFEVTTDFPSLGRRTMLLNARKLWRDNSPSGMILLGIEDITIPNLDEDQLLRSYCASQREIQRLDSVDENIVAVKHGFEEFIGSSIPMRQVLEKVEVVAPTEATVLILGETGTGKELVARAVHRMSPRRNCPFLTLNCAAIPTGLLESELFGYEKGAFTGALSQKIGRFEMAHLGTLFLDEVGDIPLNLQSKLLRALQEKSFERLGGTRTIPIDVRLVAATNRNLDEMMKDKLFRSDLYYRLKVFPITTPALRDRPEDIPALVRYFTAKYAAKMDRRIEKIPADTMRALVTWPWPGNVRELENFIERSVILSRGPILRVPVAEIQQGAPESIGSSTLEDIERAHIIRVLRESRGVVTIAARSLGLARTTLHARMRKLGISREFAPDPSDGSADII
jgi:transcriptional regulator with GAF, ATPase, and Fis domain